MGRRYATRAAQIPVERPMKLWHLRSHSVRASLELGGVRPCPPARIRARVAPPPPIGCSLVNGPSSALVEPAAPVGAPRLALLEPDPAPLGLVRRERLVQVLSTTEVPVALVVAPLGYGKTTLVEAWAATDPRTFGWMRLGPGPAKALEVLAEATAALDALGGTGGSFVLVIEDADAVQGPNASRVLGEIAAAVPPGSMLALTARSVPGLPIGRLRAHRQVIELGPRDLAMTRGEAALLLTAAGARLDPSDVGTALARTEGWPVGLYLAALSVTEQCGAAGAIDRFGGADHIVADYVREELLSRLPAGRVDFLLRTSILEPLSGDVCDAVLERAGSGSLLRGLARSELPMTAADRGEEQFRYHPLLVGMLRAELHRSAPTLEAELHGRASAWYDEHGDVAAAIEHAIAAGDFDRTGALLWRVAPTHAWDDRSAQLEHWLSLIPEHQLRRRSALALTAATSCLARGLGHEVDRWTATAERHLDRAPEQERPSLRAGAALMRCAVARDGAGEMQRQAAWAAELEPDDSPWRALCCLLQGTVLGLTGRQEDGCAVLEDGARRGAVVACGIEALCLAELALIALFDGDWEQGATLAERARSRADGLGLDDHPTLVLVVAVSAFARAYRGRVEEARGDVAAATRTLRMLDGFAPWYEAPARIALARAQLRLSNVAEARSLIAGAAKVARRIPEAELLRHWIEDGWARADTFAVDALSGPSSLTTAELRVLRFLPSHLSFREIAERLHVSANTVKTQAHAVYRKLDASSRSAAVTRACQLGLLDR
jgi:LuxR family maltose regulon positive regulatory protein